jgi:nitrous oxidase accessory protein NosD
MTVRTNGRRLVLVAAAVTALASWTVVAAAPASAHHSHHSHHTLYVSSHGQSDRSGHSCRSATYDSIQAAVNAAPAGSRVVVCRGTYREDVIVAKSLRLTGRHGATIDATGLENAVQVVASHVTVSGLRLINANGEGLLAGVDTEADAGLLPSSSPVLSDITIDHVAALYDNKGFNGTENGNCKYPGDCGGGIHLNVVSWSRVVHSRVNHNSDGILLTDDYGPNSHNLLVDNIVNDNTTECGIVLASHSSDAVSFDPTTFVVTKRNPSVGGVYDNLIIGNVTLRNGTVKAPPQFGGGGSGSGIGVFGSGPGSAAYDNLVEDNYMAGNGLAGFTIHAHHPGGEDVNGNNVIDNRVGTNNLGGDGFDGPPVTDFKTTGIAVFSVPPVRMTIRDNEISDNEIGIWLSTTVHARGLHDNDFDDVTTHIVRG